MEADFPYTNAYEYLQVIGVLDTGSEKEIEEARKEFRRLYLQQYQKKYDEKHSRITLCFTQEQKQELQQLAETNKKKIATFLKELIFNTLGNTHISDAVIKEKHRQTEIFVSLSIDVVEELIFEHPEFERNFKELLTNLTKIEQILTL